MRVLVVEDEEMLARAVAEGLRQEAFAVDVVHDGEAAMERLAVNKYDVMVLDRDLPGLHGDEVCRRTVAAGADVRVLMLTVSTTLAERVAGLNLGADDYLAKPFAFAELIARIRALGRRARPAAPPVLERSGIRLDPHYRAASRDGRLLALSRKEFAVLEELLRARGAPVSAEDLLERAWDENIDPFTTIVRVTIRGLRRKLADPPLIETITGTGYRIP
ncbi:response regulator transcription factor [Streptomyces sp. AP-93]|uniref:response regulator transcription factor n=1 Tax=Streptomyces sp. AP-93 TaxID=2929048 RepID=UPI001FAFEC90|nr:response regulator transcription factor [Streptomyces sp. AP-93]MCJ0874322.1 response regulator transcription factor [Streptomyces sp. AP-93]